MKLREVIQGICADAGNDRTRLLDVVREAQRRFGYVSGETMDAIAQTLGIHRVEVEGVVTFYAFLSREPRGKIVLRISDCITARMHSGDRVAEAFQKHLGIGFGETTPDGLISLERTSCIGMCDQGPAALCNDTVLTGLSSDRVGDIVQTLRATGDPEKLVKTLGDGNNASALIHSMVANHIRKRGPVIFAELDAGAAIRNALSMSPAEVIRNINTARLRGRGGAGFPTGMKWSFTRSAEGKQRFIIANADEGEPGTFKDRVILTECPDLLFEGMTIAGYAAGAEQGIVYLRGEYAYLKAHLENALERRRGAGLLGSNICGKEGFRFDIRIQLGAGAYICGEESALIRSAEGQRGEPRDRPPFPAQCGYLNQPTVINNVETFCCAARILEKGAPWFAKIGSEKSSGTKLFSVSGDCRSPGVYELPYGITLRQLLAEVDGKDALAVQVGGPSGACIGPDGFDRIICYDDLATGGSIIVFGPQRDMLEVASHFMEFFIEESCGWCTPCRVGNVLIKERLDRIRAGKGLPEDMEYLTDLCVTVKTMSRCGLGQTSPNPVLTTLANFRHLYEALLLEEAPDGLQPAFDLAEALGEAVRVQGREPVFHD